jgi:hypothetical protein
MNWEAIAAVGQMLGSVAVFVTLGYLAAQIRYTRLDFARSVVENRANAVRENAIMVATDEHLRSALNKANDVLGLEPGSGEKVLMERAGLDALQARQVSAYCFLMWQAGAQSIGHQADLSRDERAWSDQRFRQTWGAGIFRLWYESMKPRLRPDSVRHVDNLLAQPD